MLQYRTASYADRSGIAKLHTESWRIHYRGAYSDEYLDGNVLQDRLSVWEDRFFAPRENQFVIVAEEVGQIVGFACAYGNDDAQWGTLLDNLHVRTERHREGIGRRLLVEVARWSHLHYADCGLYLWVLSQNVRAQQFYERLGATDRGGESRVLVEGAGPCAIRRYAWATVREIVDRDHSE